MPGKLTYFGLGLRAEPIRAICFLASHEYTDERLSQEEFAERKSSLPLGALPVWEEDGAVICQSSAILRMLGIRFGFYSTEPRTMWEIDSVVDFLEENYSSALALATAPIFGREASEEDHSKWNAYFDKIVPFLNNRLVKHGQRYIGGTDHMTIADLKVF